MTDQSSLSSTLSDSSLSSVPPGATRPGLAPNAADARDPQGHFTQAFRLAAVQYATRCGKSQRAAANDLGISDKTLSTWIRDASPDRDGIVDVARFDELARLREQNRQLLAQNQRLAAERDFLKKCASYFATPKNGGSK